jgi:hypothetical protein
MTADGKVPSIELADVGSASAAGTQRKLPSEALAKEGQLNLGLPSPALESGARKLRIGLLLQIA